MRRLFSNFAHGAPGAGLLLLRVVTGLSVMCDAGMAIRRGASVELTIPYVLTGLAGILLVIGLWTPIGGSVLAVLASWSAFLHAASPSTCILLGTVGAALVLLGPGGWSVDAYRFGWKRVELPDRKS